jgi:hypothetical protein
MAAAPQNVMDHSLNLTGQNILTIASWVITVGVIVLAYRMGRKERTTIYLVMVLASMVGAFGEPLYDVMFSLWFYAGPHFQTTFTAFGIPQPNWAHSGYAILYALPAMFIVQKIWNGTMTRNMLWIFAGIEFVESCAFEITGINIGTYTYWGPHAFRIFSYPIVIGVLEAAQVMAFAVAAANVRHRMTSQWHSLALVGIFPVTMLGVNFGAGFPEILSIHANDPKVWAVRVCTIVSVGLAAGVVRMAIAMIPPAGPQVPSSPQALVERELAGTPYPSVSKGTTTPVVG